MENKILQDLNKKGTFYIFNAILSCVNKRLISQKISDKLTDLKKDDREIAGYKISEYSAAALDILELHKYDGKDENIQFLIKTQLKFN